MAWTVEGKFGNQYYIDKKGNKSECFYFCKEYYNGFGIVKKEKDGLMQYRDENGVLSEGFYQCLPYCNNFAVVQKIKNGPYQIRDIHGNLSEEFYNCEGYYDDKYFAVVQKKENGPYQFRDFNGKLSEEFSYCGSYFNGFALVKPLKDAQQCKNIFDDEPFKYRDMLGNVTDKETKLGKDIYNLSKGKINIMDLCKDCFLDTKAIDIEILPNGKKHLIGFIPDHLKREYKKEISSIDGKNGTTLAVIQIEQAKKHIKSELDYLLLKTESVKEIDRHNKKTKINLKMIEDLKNSALEEVSKM